MKKNLLKIALITLTFCLINCGGDAGGSTNESYSDNPGVSDDAPESDGNNPDTGGNLPENPENPVDPDDENGYIPIEENNEMIARLFYDGNVVDLNKDFTLSPVKTASSYNIDASFKFEEIDGRFIFNKEEIFKTNRIVKKVYYFNDRFFFNDENGFLYEIKNNSLSVISKGSSIFPAFATEYGYADNNYFYFWNGDKTAFGSVFNSKNATFRTEATGKANEINLYMMSDGKEIFISKVFKREFYQTDYALYKDKLFSLAGSVIDLKGKESLFPKFRFYQDHGVSWGEYIDGNVYLKYMNDPYRWNTFKNGILFFENRFLIGQKNDIAYVFIGRTGNLSKFNIEANSESQTFNMVKGSQKNKDTINVYDFDYDKNKAIFDKACPIFAGDKIIYFDGENIIALNPETSEKTTIVNATNFNAWVK